MQGMDTHARLFIALTPPPDVRKQLAAARDVIHLRVSGKPVADSKLHLTLAFLGQTPRTRLEELTQLIDRSGFLPLDLQLNQYGCFTQAQVVWLGLPARHIALDGLAQRLGHGLRTAGFNFEDRPFSPHVTLLRKATCPPERLPQPVIWHANQLSLYESVSTPDGVEYRALQRVLAGFGR